MDIITLYYKNAVCQAQKRGEPLGDAARRIKVPRCPARERLSRAQDCPPGMAHLDRLRSPSVRLSEPRPRGYHPNVPGPASAARPAQRDARRDSGGSPHGDRNAGPSGFTSTLGSAVRTRVIKTL